MSHCYGYPAVFLFLSVRQRDSLDKHRPSVLVHRTECPNQNIAGYKLCKLSHTWISILALNVNSMALTIYNYSLRKRFVSSFLYTNHADYRNPVIELKNNNNLKKIVRLIFIAYLSKTIVPVW